MRPFIRDFSQPGECVLDPFCGFATTLIAAECEGRRGVGWEVEPLRTQLAQERLARLECHHQTVVHPDESRPAERFDLIATNVPYFGSAWRGSAPAQLYASETYTAHLEDLRQQLIRWKRVLRPAGYLIVMVENLRIGPHFVPFAWDLARLLGERFVMKDERILVYPRGADEGGSPDLTNRAHEYALVAQNGPRTIDKASTLEWLHALRQVHPGFVVFGSFAKWLRAPGHHVQPSDADLTVPCESGSVAAMAGWFEARGFRITRWGVPAAAPVTAMILPHTEYFRAERLSSDGTLCLFDIYFGGTSAFFLEAQRRSVMVEALPTFLEDDLPAQPAH